MCLVGAYAMAFNALIPETKSYCIDPDSTQTATGYCKNLAEEPAHIILACSTIQGFRGQSMTCIGNLLEAEIVEDND